MIHQVGAVRRKAWRAEITLLSAGGLATVEIRHRTGKSKTYVWRWQERFAEEGVDGLLRDKTRPSRVATLGQEVIGARAYRGLTGERQYPPLAVQFGGHEPTLRIASRRVPGIGAQ